MAENKAVLGYWPIRGLAQSIRYVLEYTKTPYEDKKYGNDWFGNDKETLGLPLANLPYLIDGENKICQSFAILRCLGRKNGLIPSDEKNIVRVEMAEREAHDVQQKYIILAYRAKDLENDKKAHLTYLEGELKKFEDFLGDREYFGEKVSYADFYVYEVLDVNNDLFAGNLFEKFPKLKAYHQRVQGLLADYLKSDRFVAHPINGSSALVK